MPIQPWERADTCCAQSLGVHCTESAARQLQGESAFHRFGWRAPLQVGSAPKLRLIPFHCSSSSSLTLLSIQSQPYIFIRASSDSLELHFGQLILICCGCPSFIPESLISQESPPSPFSAALGLSIFLKFNHVPNLPSHSFPQQVLSSNKTSPAHTHIQSLEKYWACAQAFISLRFGLNATFLFALSVLGNTSLQIFASIHLVSVSRVSVFPGKPCA